jgi:spore maturation protein CgeB
VRIGIVGSTDPDTFEDNIAFALGDMGHSVVGLGSARPRIRNRFAHQAADLILQAYPRVEEKFHDRIVCHAIEEECQVVLTTDGRLGPLAVRKMRQSGIATVLWYPDPVTSMGRQRMLTAPYNAMFFKDALLVRRLRGTLGIPVWHLPEACNPQWHKPIGRPGSKKHIVVAGNTYMTRLLLLERLHRDGVPLIIYGNPVPRWAPRVIPPSLHQGRLILREQKSRVFREAAAVLNNIHPAEMSGVNARLFEAAAAGAAVLCERRPELSKLFDTKREVLPFTTYEELLERIRELLDDVSVTKSVGDAASKRAHADHTYEDRLAKILEKVA